MVVVDALRTDFVSLHTGKNWPYLETLIRNKKAYVADARVHPPTVTLPRIKVSCQFKIHQKLDQLIRVRVCQERVVSKV